MRINLLLKITLVAFVLLGLSLRSAVSAGGSDEEVFPPKTLEKLKKNYYEAHNLTFEGCFETVLDRGLIHMHVTAACVYFLV